ncbi:MAG TPA: isochorismatase family cysteine hydrolase [Bryobacteraceae bacterium]|nr:isochorismatase family cysteine hydrolase [Bryobacteraceae bacterium]
MSAVFFDVDTQLDFLYPAGALCVAGAEEIVPTLAKLTEFAAARKIQIISTTDAHLEDDAEFKVWKPHCVAGTFGQQKEAVTRLAGMLVLGPAMPVSAPQIIVEKRALDAFSNPHLSPLLDALRADRYVLYGVVTELCVRCAADGLLRTGARVELVMDAVKALSKSDEESFFRDFQVRGGILTSSAAVLNG